MAESHELGTERRESRRPRAIAVCMALGRRTVGVTVDVVLQPFGVQCLALAMRTVEAEPVGPGESGDKSPAGYDMVTWPRIEILERIRHAGHTYYDRSQSSGLFEPPGRTLRSA